MSGVYQGQIFRRMQFNVFARDVESGIERTLSKFAKNTELCGLVTLWREGIPECGLMHEVK